MADDAGWGWIPSGASVVSVEAASRRYPVIVGTRLLEHLGRLVRERVSAGAAKAMLAWDDGLPGETVATARDSLRAEGWGVSEHGLHASETAKSLETVQALLRAMGEARLERTDPLVALGGGIVGDVAGFGAATYRRGVPVVQCPTTLLAMVDASVGGKTGVNLAISSAGGQRRLVKNLVGSFHQPHVVVADTTVLASLDRRDYVCGLAECVKHAMIGADHGDAGLLDWLEANVTALLAREPEALGELIIRNVRIKAAIVGADEREETASGGRMLLNLGHTFGHAIETMEGVAPDGDRGRTPPRHGEAVAIGLCCACRCAVVMGLVGKALEERVRELLLSLGLPTVASGVAPTPDVIDAMKDDKKAGAGRMRVVLPVAPGRCRVVEDPAPASIAAAIDAIRCEDGRRLVGTP